MGLGLDSHWTLNDLGSTYTVDGSGRTLAFRSFENLFGLQATDVFTVAAGFQHFAIWAGAGNDTLALLDNAVLAGAFDGQGGYDTIDASAYTTPRAFYLLAVLGSTDGFNGTESSILGGFFNIQQLIGSLSANSLASADSLHGRDVDATYNLGTPVEHYTDASGRSLDFQYVEDIYGGSAVDTMYLTGPHTGRLYGQGGDDIFNVSGNGTLTGFIDGGAGYDTLDYTAYASARAFVLTALGPIDGFSGAESSLSLGFINVNYLLGRSGSGLDSLQGLGTDSVWTLNSAAVKSQYTTQGYSLDFSYIDSLIGLGGQDRFVFEDGVSLAGSIDGGAGCDTLDYSNYTTARDLNLSGLSGTDGFAGSEASLGEGFTHINQVIGGSALDTLRTLDSASTFTIDQANGGSYATGGNTLDFLSFDNLVAGAGADVFNFVGSGTIAGSINAGAGTDLISYALYHTGVMVDLLNGATTGVDGGANGAISGFENITGSAFADSLSGDDGPNVITGLGGNDVMNGRGGDDTYVFGENWGADSVTDTAGSNTFDFSSNTTGVAFQLSAALLTVSGSGSVTAGAGMIENLIGGSGVDTLDYHLYGSGRSVTLTGAGTLDGFAGTEAAAGSFDNINVLVGSGSEDSLIGLASGGVFNVSGLQAGSYVSAGRTLAFSAVDLLSGLAGSDTLAFSVPANVTLTGANADGFSGTDPNLAFTGMDLLQGNTASDSLTGMNSTATFGVGGSEYYQVGGFSLALSGFETLIGGSLSDTFKVTGPHTGTLDGGAGGLDSLDYSGYALPIYVVLTGAGVHGFNGTEALSLSGGFRDIDRIVANPVQLGNNSLTGTNVASSWSITPSVNQVSAASRTLAFSEFGIIRGGSGADTFAVSGATDYSLNGGDGNDTFLLYAGATLAGSLDGGTGNNTLSYYDPASGLSYTTPVTVNLNNSAVVYNGVSYPADSATGIASGLLNIQNVTGGAGNDILIGSAVANILNGGPGNDVLLELGGDDTYVFGNAWGKDTISDTAGNDTISFASSSANLVFQIGTTSLTVSDGTASDLLTASPSEIENLIGGAGNDTFRLANGAALAGSLDGQAGVDTLDFSAATTARNFVLTGLGSVDGFTGMATGIGGGFNNINALRGGSGSDSLSGMNTDSAFTINGISNSYREIASGRSLGLSSIENLTGGSANDIFYMVGTASLAGYINGGAGTDTLDYSAYATAISVNLAAGTATGVGGGISQIENLVDSPFGNVIYGDNNRILLSSTASAIPPSTAGAAMIPISLMRTIRLAL